jgi:16S rRNA (adenine1518-N6/adenine1519-N6)-dimethyltransferase
MRAKKSLGQHFLNSKHVLEQIISASEIKISETILEIGPGTGILTEALLKTGAYVTAIEKDVRANDLLKEKFAKEISSGQLKLIHGDILTEKIDTPTPYALVANIPYYITGAILEKFLEHGPRPDRMVLLVQKEVAERIVARPEQSTGKRKESVLSISVKAFGIPKIIANVPPGAFTPPPTVDSAILSIEHISDKGFESVLTKNPDGVSRFFEIVKAGFAHKRKFVRRNLEGTMSPEEIDGIWKSLNLNEKERAEDLTPPQWLEIATKNISN